MRERRIRTTQSHGLNDFIHQALFKEREQHFKLYSFLFASQYFLMLHLVSDIAAKVAIGVDEPRPQQKIAFMAIRVHQKQPTAIPRGVE